MTSLIGYRNFTVLYTSLHVMYKLFLSMFIKLNMDSLYETVSSFSSRFHGPEQHNNKNSEIN